MIPDLSTAKTATILGLGNFGGGVGAARFLAQRGLRVIISDQQSEAQLAPSLAQLGEKSSFDLRLGGHHESDLLDADFVVVNPAIRRDHPLLQFARERNIPLTSEMNLFVQHCRGRLLAVTGSNGKSTTTAMLAHILQQSSRRTWLGGNIGISLLPHVDEIHPDDHVVLELSSFQLNDLDRIAFSPSIAVVTNFTPNHLDWHGDLSHYRHAKQTLLRWQSESDVAVLNADDPEVSHWPTQAQRLLFGTDIGNSFGIELEGHNCRITLPHTTEEWPLSEWCKLPGDHNQTNAAAAALAALAAGADRQAIQRGLETFQPLPHRLEFVTEVAGRKFYNDSIATTPESVFVALDAFKSPLILLAGGYDKGIDLAPLAQALARRTKAVACLGQTGPVLHEHIDQSPASHSQAHVFHDFPAAFQWAWAQSQPGDIVLLSPGCASYDWFQNFADRGQQFRDLARTLAHRL